MRCHAIERWVSWETRERVLIVVPHQDDCVICAGGIAIRNQNLGGETHIIYLVQDDKPGMCERRKAEAIAAWALAGVTADCLRHLDLLPALYERNPVRLSHAALELKRLIDEISPSVLIMPIFEGGHIHHDLTNHIVSSIVDRIDSIRVFESPEYSPFVSLRWTPHRIIALCGRWLFGLVAYYGPPDGIDDRTVYKVRLDRNELALKRQMLAAFASQNGESLMATRTYPDRIVEWRRRQYRARPFDLECSFLGFVQRLERWMPTSVVNRVFPLQRGTVGREPSVTDLDHELGELLDTMKS